LGRIQTGLYDQTCSPCSAAGSLSHNNIETTKINCENQQQNNPVNSFLSSTQLFSHLNFTNSFWYMIDSKIKKRKKERNKEDYYMDPWCNARAYVNV
jgi:hypothetical protein